MADAIMLPVETDPDTLALIAFDYIRARYPGWEPAEGDLLTTNILAVARVIAEGRQMASDVSPAILRWFGATIFRIPPLAATAASVVATVTAVDDAGYTIPAGSRFQAKTSGDDGVQLVSTVAVTIPPRSTVTAVGEVQLVAAVPGAAGNGVGPANQTVAIDDLAWIDRVELASTASGGVEAELDDAYLTRLTDELALLTPTPIQPEQFATLSKRIPGVGRALALNLYNPADDTYDNPRMVTVAVVDINGVALGSAVRTAAQTLLAGTRETNFIVHVIDPTYTRVGVSFSFTTWDGWDPVDVKVAGEGALASWLSGATWGSSPLARVLDWNDTPVVRIFDAVSVLLRVGGLRSVTDLRLARGTGALAATDVTMTGPAALPLAGTITGTPV